MPINYVTDESGLVGAGRLSGIDNMGAAAIPGDVSQKPKTAPIKRPVALSYGARSASQVNEKLSAPVVRLCCTP